MNRATGVALVVLTTVVPRSAFAQHDLSEWSARYHEDQEHRIPGPALVDYTGLPINEAARLKADLMRSSKPSTAAWLDSSHFELSWFDGI